MAESSAMRSQLIELVDEIIDQRDRGQDSSELLAEFERLLPGTDVDNLCNSDQDSETIVDICLGEKHSQRVLTREELLELVTKLQSPMSGNFKTEAESILAVETFIRNCKHPAGSDLIFYPEEHFEGRTELSAEEIVDLAIRGE